MTQAQTKAETNGKGFGQDPKQSKATTGQASGQDSRPEVLVDSNIAGMRSMAEQTLNGIRQGLQNIEEEHIEEAQLIVDEASQLMSDIASGRLIFEAIADNVTYLLEQNTREVEKPSLGKHRLNRSSLKLLRPATPQDLSTRALKGTDKQ